MDPSDRPRWPAPRHPATAGRARQAHASPALLYATCVLTLLLAILEADIHHDRLAAAGFFSDTFGTLHP